MDTTLQSDPRMVGTALLLARLVLGLIMAAHGTQKLFGWFGGHGLTATGEFFVQLGFAPGRLFATAASVGEVVSGLLLAFGFLGPVGPAIMIAVMIVAAVTVHWHGLFAASNGVELPLLYATGALGIALAGAGPYSLDALLGLSGLWTPKLVAAILAVGVVGAFGNLLMRRRPAQARRA
jgi:putative oxidoreductase